MEKNQWVTIDQVTLLVQNGRGTDSDPIQDSPLRFYSTISLKEMTELTDNRDISTPN
jgi:hypothetical protein